MTPDSTINPDELAFYESLSAFWWDQSGPFWPLHRLNTLRVAWIVEQACKHFRLAADTRKPPSTMPHPKTFPSATRIALPSR